MKEWLQYVFLGNTVQSWLIAIGIILALLLLVRIIRTIVLKKLKNWAEKTETTVDDFMVVFVQKSILPILYIFSIYSGLHYLWLSPKAEKVLYIIVALLVTFFIIRLVTSLLGHLLDVYATKKGQEPSKKLQMRGLMLVVNIIIWGIGLIFLFDNLGYDVTAVVAGLGIGGIAIALAVQKILGDIFSYFVIFFDRPFEIGDYIVIDHFKGTVEHVGLKTTRLRSLSGEELVFSNTDLTNSRLHNFKKLQRRRIAFKIGVTYQTTQDQLKQIPVMITQIINGIADTTLDRVHFMAFGAFSLDFEIVYFVESSEYNYYMDIQQRINLEINQAIIDAGIEFAYPTQTLFMEAGLNDESEEKSTN
ncbi:MAG: mechanosensitive ion channel family protein [Chitinophagaceae bacterium]|nr:mechanosensitive ion channel family protein [Chitinophagaceae bacterium]